MEPKVQKEMKKKGPIRTEAVVPSLILLALVYGYFVVFFDGHLRRGLEFAATRIHGAEVNIGRIDTSFLRASFLLKDLEVTDKTQPARNLFQIGDIRFGMLWDALLRGKVVVEDASVLDIQAYTQRKKPGYVLPPPPPGGGPSLIGKVQDQVLSQAKAKIQDNFLGDLASMAGGVDPREQLQNIQAELKSSAHLKNLEKELTEKRAAWEKRIRELPKPQDLKALETQAKALNLNSKNPAEIAQNIKKAKEIVDSAQSKIKQVDDTQKDLNNDLTAYTKAVGDMQKMIDQDVFDLQKRLQLPDLDPKSFSQQIFGNMMGEKLASVRKYVTVARKYMPPKKTPEQIEAEKAEQLLPPARGEGKTFTFPVTKGYPLFWLKKAAISSEINQSEWSGKVKGELRHVSTDPSIIGQPLQLQLQGDFPKQQVLGLDFLATIDHTTEVAKESLKLAVGSFPLTNLVLMESAETKLGIQETSASSQLLASLADEQLNVKFQGRFEKPQFELAMKSKQVQEVLLAILRGIPTVTMAAEVTGSWDSFSMNLNSNLGSELSQGFQKQLQAKVGEAKAKIQAFVQSKIGGDKEKVEGQVQALQSGPAKVLGQNKEEMNKTLKSLQDLAKGGAGGGLQEKGKQLLRGFGI